MTVKRQYLDSVLKYFQRTQRETNRVKEGCRDGGTEIWRSGDMERDTSMNQINGTNCNTSPALVLPWSIP